MHLPVIGQHGHLLGQKSMLDKTACVGIAFHAVVFDQPDSLFGRFGKFVPCVYATATTVPFKARLLVVSDMICGFADADGCALERGCTPLSTRALRRSFSLLNSHGRALGCC